MKAAFELSRGFKRAHHDVGPLPRHPSFAGFVIVIDGHGLVRICSGVVRAINKRRGPLLGGPVFRFEAIVEFPGMDGNLLVKGIEDARHGWFSTAIDCK